MSVSEQSIEYLEGLLERSKAEFIEYEQEVETLRTGVDLLSMSLAELRGANKVVIPPSRAPEPEPEPELEPEEETAPTRSDFAKPEDNIEGKPQDPVVVTAMKALPPQFRGKDVFAL